MFKWGTLISSLDKPFSTGVSFVICPKTLLILVVVIGAITLLGKIEFPYPNKDVEKIIPNEKFKIVK